MVSKFGWNPGSPVDDWQCGPCNDFNTEVQNIVTLYPEKKVVELKIDSSPDARQCVSETVVKGYDVYNVKSRHELPNVLVKGYDYNDPCLWEPGKDNVYLVKQENQEASSRTSGIFGQLRNLF